jgi:hypothetical protein
MAYLVGEQETRTVREILRERHRREDAKAIRQTVATFVKEFLTLLFLFAALFYGVGGLSSSRSSRDDQQHRHHVR